MKSNSYSYSNDMDKHLLNLFQNEQHISKSKSNSTIPNSKKLSVNENSKSKNKIVEEKSERKNLKVLDKSIKDEDNKQININKNNPEPLFVNRRNLISNRVNLINVHNELTFINCNVNNNTIENNNNNNNIIDATYIRNNLRPKPPKMNHYYEQKYEFLNKNIFSGTNNTIGKINEKISNNFLNHLLIVESNRKKKVLSMSITRRIKSKVTMFVYYCKG